MPIANKPSQSPLHQWQKHKSKQRVEWELPRKLYHSIHGLIMITLYTLLPSWRAHDFLPILIPPFLLYFYIDHLRLVDPNVNTAFVKVAGKTMRPAERLAIRLTSSSAYMAGLLVALCVFEKRVAVLACLYLAFVDTAAAFGGRLASLYLGSNLNKKIGYSLQLKPSIHLARTDKSVGGFVAAFMTAAVIYYYMVNGPNVWQLTLGGLIGGVAEAVTIDGVDDDLSLPLLAGTMLTLFKSFLGLQ